MQKGNSSLDKRKRVLQQDVIIQKLISPQPSAREQKHKCTITDTKLLHDLHINHEINELSKYSFLYADCSCVNRGQKGNVLKSLVPNSYFCGIFYM